MRLILLALVTLFVGGLFVVYGTLLVWRPDLFLKFHDTFIDRGASNKKAAWRNSVSSREFKFLGIVLGLFGILITYVVLIRLLSSLS